MAPRAHRRKLAAAALAAACAVVYLWMLFAWETAWGIDLKHRDSPPWLVGTFWEMQWAVACAALVLLAALCAAAEGLELWKRPPPWRSQRAYGGDGAAAIAPLMSSSRTLTPAPPRSSCSRPSARGPTSGTF